MALFTELGLSSPILQALSEEGYASPTPIQERSIPVVLAGRDMIGCAQTGTGKTAAFSLPILELLGSKNAVGAIIPTGNAHERTPGAGAAAATTKMIPSHKSGGGGRSIRCLVLTPTRELAIQIGESMATYGRHLHLKHTVIFGGVGQGAQTNALRSGVDILIATPGRLLDLMGQGFVDLRYVEIFVLDEADRMLDMGFVHDVRKVLTKIPTDRQTLLFSATMPDEIVKLSQTILKNPTKIEVTPVSSTAEKVSQEVYFVSRTQKRLLLAYLLKNPEMRQVLIFSKTKHGADKIVKELIANGERAEAIHGNKSQNARQRALSGFKDGNIRVLVATDIAARGIDIDELKFVVNYDLPNEPETYVHRIGRTGRAGASGLAISFCDGEERAYLRDIERLIRKSIPVIADHPFPTNGDTAQSEAAAADAAKRAPRGRSGFGGGRAASARGGGSGRPPRSDTPKSPRPAGGSPASAPRPGVPSGPRPPRPAGHPANSPRGGGFGSRPESGSPRGNSGYRGGGAGRGR